ncbi:MAG: DUF58 domain-containing protein [Planctomycetes bacterium]|nr:DUF58 domain-containing protein [Planctomycetota bacterium]
MRAEQYLAPETLAQLGPFELRAKRIAEGVMSGMHRSPYQGLAVEFAEHRQYAAGDPVRHIDWKVFGRSDKLYLKRFQQETNLDIHVLVDCSGSMRYGSLGTKDGWGGTRTGKPATWTKFDHATAAAAAMAFLGLSQRDRVSTEMFAGSTVAATRCSNAQGHWRSIVRCLATNPVDGKADLGRAVDALLARAPHRSLMVLVSDFLLPQAMVRDSLARLRHCGHDAILVRVLDRQELSFDALDDAPFQGLEGEPALEVDARSVREAYLEVLAEDERALERMVRGFGFDLVRLDTHESVGPALAALLARRDMLFRGTS